MKGWRTVSDLNSPSKDEIKKLDELARRVTIYLIVVSTIALFAGYYVLSIHLPSDPAWAVTWGTLGIALLGFSGSGTAALTSCLDRYAHGYETDSGKKFPEAAGGETFNRRFARWLYARPFLGALIAPPLTWGIVFFVRESEQWLSSAQHLAFTAFLAGLLAKSVVELMKGLFKNIFKA
jgi:hypothetical protein